MPAWESRPSVVPGEHLPPPEVCSLLVAKKNGRVAVRYTIDTPVDELGIPDGPSIIKLVNSTVDPNYEWPGSTNVHHLCYPRRAYEADPVAREFREGAGLMVRMPIQPHNLLHRLLNDFEMPDREVMVERNREQRQVDRLFKLGRTSIRYGKWARQFVQAAEDPRTSYREPAGLAHFYQTLSNIYAGRYLDYLEKIESGPGVTGLRPDAAELIDIDTATKRLGRIAGSGYVDAHRSIQERSEIRLTA